MLVYVICIDINHIDIYLPSTFVMYVIYIVPSSYMIVGGELAQLVRAGGRVCEPGDRGTNPHQGYYI